MERLKFAQDRALKAEDRAGAVKLAQFEAALQDGRIDNIRETADGVIGIKNGQVVTLKDERGNPLKPRATGSDFGFDEPPIAATPASAPARAIPPTETPAVGKTMTQADIEATAKARGITPAAAKMVLEQLGYELAK